MEDFVTYELAVKLKDKGFNWICSHYYRTKCKDLFMVLPSEDWGNTEERINAPTISQVLKWLREKKGWIIVVRLYSTNGWYWFIQDKNGELKSSHLASCDDCFATYEQAALAGIEYALDKLI